MRLLALLLTAAVFVSAVLGSAVPHVDLLGLSDPPLDFGTKHIEFKSEIMQDTKLRFVRNSGVCETTPGVNQLSGYIDIGTNMSMVRARICDYVDVVVSGA